MKEEKGFIDLSDVEKLIGKEQELTEQEAYLTKCPVDTSELRRYALAVEDCNPLWFDREYAGNTKWKDIIAPPTFMHTCGGGSAAFVHIPGTDDWPHGNLFAGSDLEFYLPIRIGDIITPISSFYGFTEKKGNFVGPMVIVTAETKYTNQKDDLVGVYRQSVIKYSTEKAKEKGQYMSEEIGPMFPSGYPDLRKGEITARGAKPLYYEDVEIGTELPPMVRHLTIPKIVSMSDISQRSSIILPHTLPGPGCYWHYIPGESLKLRGLPAPMDEGPMRAAQPSQLITDWMGDDGWLNRLTMQVRRPIYAGDTTTWKGKVIKKHIKDNTHFIECEFWGESQRGEVSTRGSAEVILPSQSQ
ncbi:MaoC family dehydratase N-terminal domain-containing protein [Thermodesulfobacteriota bacterium]